MSRQQHFVDETLNFQIYFHLRKENILPYSWLVIKDPTIYGWPLQWQTLYATFNSN